MLLCVSCFAPFVQAPALHVQAHSGGVHAGCVLHWVPRQVNGCCGRTGASVAPTFDKRKMPTGTGATTHSVNPAWPDRLRRQVRVLVDRRTLMEGHGSDSFSVGGSTFSLFMFLR